MISNHSELTAAGAMLLALLIMGACSREREEPVTAAPATVGGQISTNLEAPGAAPSFEDHPVFGIERIARPAAVDLGTHPDAPRFRTALLQGAAAGPNFAGELTVVTWGCGTMCQQMMLVHGHDGRIIATLEAALGFEYRLDSRLLIANPPAAVRENPCPTCTTSYHLWQGGELLRIPEQAWLGSTPIPARTATSWRRCVQRRLLRWPAESSLT